MRKQTKVLLIASAIVGSLAAAPELLAQDARDQGMMGKDKEMKGMMGKDKEMKGMMGSMMKMMEHCDRMMGDTSPAPNEKR